MPSTRYEALPKYRQGKDHAADMAEWAKAMAADNHVEHERIKRNLVRALREDVTARQRQFLLLYYGKGMSMREIGAQCGVGPSTVSRTIKRGEARLRRCLRYGAGRLLEPPEED